MRPTEWLDIVDEQDRVVGRDTRAKIHADGLRHRSSHIVLFNTRGEVFVQLRSKLKDTGAGLWDSSAAGHVDSGESYLDCAVRELREELGIEVNPDAMSLAGKLTPNVRTGFEFTQVYSVCSEQPIVLQAEEIDDGRWVSPAELDSWLSRNAEQFTDAFKIVWALVQKHSAHHA